MNYGFCLNNNKYNSLSFRVWVNFNWKKDAEKLVDEESKIDEDDNRISKIIRLKKNRINEEIFAYLRANLLNTYKGKNVEHLLISTPVDYEFEMLVVACTINLLKGLLNSRFKTPIEEDLKILSEMEYQKEVDTKLKFAVLHRLNTKDILC